MRNSTRARAIVVAVVGGLLAIGTPSRAEAQNALISGKVTSDVGQPLAGANVYITDLSISVATNAEGAYTITIPSARCCGQLVNLRVRALGFRPGLRPIRVVAGTTSIDFTLQQDVNRLDEIVVTGSLEGIERAKVPFAVGRLTTEDMPVPALDPVRALAGKVAGVRIAQTSGRPGSTPEIMLRGPTSINATGRGQGPLIIVDGAIMNVGSMEELGGLDIESVEVVKGAAGASLYGTRAANGVITIKTKRGATGADGIRFNVRSEYGISDMNSLDYGMPINHHLALDETGKRFCVTGELAASHCSQTFEWNTEIQRINAVNADTVRIAKSAQWNAASVGGGVGQNVFQSQIWPGQYYNTFAQFATQNPIALTQVDATGRLGGVRFYVSGSYQDEQGAVRDVNGIQQRRGRVNLDYDMRHDLVISVSSLFDNATNDLRSAGGSFGALLRGAPAGTDYARRDTLGRYLIRGGGAGLRGSGNGGGTFLYNNDNNNEVNLRTSNRFLGNVSANYFPAEWVTVEALFAYDNRTRRDDFWRVKGFRTQGISTANNNGNIDIENRDTESFNTSLTATFRKQLRSDLNGKLSVRGLYDESSFLQNSAEGQIFLVKDIFTLDNTSANEAGQSESESVRNQGYSVGAQVDWKDRYIFDGTFRYDGSSLFGSKNRWAPFGRVSAIWRVSEEPFWTVPQVSDFRLRASRGTAGSTPRFNAQYETYQVNAAGVSLGRAGNSELKPETTTEIEVGTDFTLFNRLGVEFTHARSRTEDQILLVGTPASLGFNEQWKNAGTLTNRTFELGLNLPVLNRRDLQWNLRGTWDRTRTFIDELFVPEFVFNGGTDQGTAGFFHITDETSPSNGFQINRYGNIWGRKFLKSCAELRSEALRADCGEGRSYQVNDQGYLVWVGAGNSWRDGITRNLWQTVLPGSASPFGNRVPLYFGMPIIDRPLRGEAGEGAGISQILGNVFPDYRFTFSNNVTYKRLNLYALLDATIGHDIYNQGEQWGLFDFNSSTFDTERKTVETAKPIGYGWRTGPSEGAGIGGFYDVLGPNNYSVEDGSYAKLREVSLTYKVGAVRGIGDWTIGMVGRNLLTFTNYTGYDPEIGVSGGSTGTPGSSTRWMRSTSRRSARTRFLSPRASRSCIT